jgi:hypothetical protein
MEPAGSPRPPGLSSRAAVAPGGCDLRRTNQTDAIVQAVSEIAERHTRNAAAGPTPSTGWKRSSA